MLTVNIQLRVMHTEAARDAVIIKLVRILAKQLLAQAALLQDFAEPDIRIEAGDFNQTTTEVKLFDEDGSEFDTELIEAINRFGNPEAGLKRMILNARKREEEAS